jgi:hypothetical protein
VNPEIKERWLEALRSGEYKQGRKLLSSVAEDGTVSYCCLGVLCELAHQSDLVTKVATAAQDGAVQYRGAGLGSDGPQGSTAYLPYDVMKWAGLPDSEGYIPQSPQEDHLPTSLASMNDTGFTFAEIADVIEARF